MTGSVQSPEQVVNQALIELGYEAMIGSLYEGSKASKFALAVYAEVRDELIENGEWEFAERTIIGVLLKQAPPAGYGPMTPWSNAYPSLPWRYEYSYPSDCVKLRSVRPQMLGLINPNPWFNRFSLDNDNSFTPAQRVVLCDVPYAILTYAGRVTDPTTWDAAFTKALRSALVEQMGTLKSLAVSRAESEADRMAAEAEMK